MPIHMVHEPDETQALNLAVVISPVWVVGNQKREFALFYIGVGKTISYAS